MGKLITTSTNLWFQQNTQILEKIFWEVSTPGSPKYGQFLTADEVSRLVAPTTESLQTVTAWLTQYGIKVSECS